MYISIYIYLLLLPLPPLPSPPLPLSLSLSRARSLSLSQCALCSALVEEIVNNLEVFQKLNNTSGEKDTERGPDREREPAVAPFSKLVLRRGAEQSAGGVAKRRRKEPAGD